MNYDNIFSNESEKRGFEGDLRKLRRTLVRVRKMDDAKELIREIETLIAQMESIL